MIWNKKKKMLQLASQDLAFNDLKDYFVITCWNPSTSQGPPEPPICPDVLCQASTPRAPPYQGRQSWHMWVLRCWGLGGITVRRSCCPHHSASVPKSLISAYHILALAFWPGCSHVPPTLISEPLSVHLVIFFLSDSDLFYLLVPTCLGCLLLPSYLFRSGQDLHTLPALYPPEECLVLSHSLPFSQQEIPLH